MLPIAQPTPTSADSSVRASDLIHSWFSPQSGVPTKGGSLSIQGNVEMQGLTPTMNAHPQITADPRVMTGMACIKGTRVTVANVVRQIAAGRAPDEICRDYPYLSLESIQAALEFAADISASETYELLAS